ncbi:MAG: DUF445 domain-containing protein [Saprospiraceae bacterium]|nr:DUF445 domain-containing protein [Saprospiraceae bacterium]
MLEYIQSHPSIIILPFISAIIGWGTNVVALKMTFYPLEFIGFKFKGFKAIGWGGFPPIGWQGIIPSKAETMAGKATDMITTKLIDVEDQFSRINPAIVAKEMESSILRLSREITNEVMTEHVPFWKLLSNKQKEKIYARSAEEIPSVIEEIMEEVKVNITEVFDLKAMAVEHLRNNKELLNRIFLEVGDKEFSFIERSGFYFGFLFGILQAIIWVQFEANWTLPVGGLLVGYLTNILALRLIFSPTKPIKIFKWKIQGLFIKRQNEVSKGYAHLVSDNIMTMDNVFTQMFNGKGADKLVNIITKHSREGIDKTAGFNSSLIKFTSGTDTYDQIKTIAVNRFIEAAPEQIHIVFDYAKQALDIEETMFSRMTSLPPDEFVDFLRPVFQEDEWKLILTGAILGMAAGFLQLLFVIF